MEDLNDLLFDIDIGESCVDPSMSFEEMENMILNDNVDESKEIEDISFGHMKPIPKCLMQDGESIKENETEVQ